MKINIDQIPAGGLTQEKAVPAESLDLDTEVVKFRGPLAIKADVSQITNTVIVDLDLNARISLVCVRCLDDFETDFTKHLKLNFSVEKYQHEIDLDPEIRQDIIIEYPIKPLCKLDCKGLCPKCGQNLNADKCKC
jgi:uncharacterized protein